MREITFKKFIYINKKLEEGMAYPRSIITYLSKPWTLEYFKIQNPDPTTITAKIEARIIEFRKLLIIDLWFIELKFDWIKKISYPQSCVDSDTR